MEKVIPWSTTASNAKQRALLKLLENEELSLDEIEEVLGFSYQEAKYHTDSLWAARLINYRKYYNEKFFGLVGKKYPIMLKNENEIKIFNALDNSDEPCGISINTLSNSTGIQKGRLSEYVESLTLSGVVHAIDVSLLDPIDLCEFDGRARMRYSLAEGLNIKGKYLYVEDEPYYGL